MKSVVYAALSAAFILLNVPGVKAESTWVYTVQISAAVQTSPPRITLNWQPDIYGANSYTVYRKRAGDASWGSGTTLAGATSSYADSNVAVGSTYEYKIVKAGTPGYTGYGYIYAGINAPMAENRGKLVLVVDNTFTVALSNELARLESDLIGDGWTVVRRNVGRADSPASVRAVIQNVYTSDPSNVKAVFLFGHVPILRSGSLNIDGHQARALPADAYYADMDGSWNNQSYLPSDVELMSGRVDLFNMPGNGSASPWPSEQEMLRNYLNKDHNWRHKILTVPKRALMGNRFGDFNGEAFAASGYRNFEPLVGPGTLSTANEQNDALTQDRWTSMLGAGTYLWAYGCGGGSYTSMSFMGTHGIYFDAWSTDIVDLNAKAVFTMMFGSWLGEWDSADNLMRSVLATPTMGLTCSWAGRPHWYYHHMALGEPIGYSARVSQNNGGLYQNQVNQFQRGIHIALMGDPTLRLDQVAPPSGLLAASVSGGLRVTWTASSDSVFGYHVYRATNSAGPFTRLSSTPVTALTFTDSNALAGTNTYMVRAVKLETTPSGTYTNQSQGVFANAIPIAALPTARVSASKAPNGLALSWPSQIGQTYQVYAKTRLTDTVWTPLSASIVAAASTCTWTDTAAAANPSRFYRIMVP